MKPKGLFIGVLLSLLFAGLSAVHADLWNYQSHYEGVVSIDEWQESDIGKCAGTYPCNPLGLPYWNTIYLLDGVYFANTNEPAELEVGIGVTRDYQYSGNEFAVTIWVRNPYDQQVNLMNAPFGTYPGPARVQLRWYEDKYVRSDFHISTIPYDPNNPQTWLPSGGIVQFPGPPQTFAPHTIYYRTYHVAIPNYMELRNTWTDEDYWEKIDLDWGTWELEIFGTVWNPGEWQPYDYWRRLPLNHDITLYGS